MELDEAARFKCSKQRVTVFGPEGLKTSFDGTRRGYVGGGL